MQAKGSFDVSMTGEPPYDEVDGVTLGRASFAKTFRGALEAESKVSMLAARTTIPTSAGYVAIERIVGSLQGKRGTFVVLHTGLMTRGAPSLTITIVPDSGTGELAGISGSMSVQIVEGKHFYELDFELPTL